MASFVFTTPRYSVIETENTYTVWEADGTCFCSSYIKSNPLAIFQAIADAMHLSGHKYVGNYNVISVSQMDFFTKLQSDLYEINQIRTWPTKVDSFA